MLNQQYTHYVTEETYTTLRYCKVRLADKWVDGVIYFSEDGEMYARPIQEFISKFTLIRGCDGN